MTQTRSLLRLSPVGIKLDDGEAVIKKGRAYLHRGWRAERTQAVLTNKRFIFEMIIPTHATPAHQHELRISNVSRVERGSFWARFKVGSFKGLAFSVVKVTIKDGECICFQAPKAALWIRAIEAHIK